MRKLNPDFFRLRPFIAVCSLLALVAACSPRMASVSEPGEFTDSEAALEDVLSTLELHSPSIESLTGRASARVSSPDLQEQVTLTFTSDKTRSLLAMRNNLGIEGGRIFADQDSVVVYDRIERKAWKMSVEESHRVLLNGFTAFNVMEFLMPQFDAGDISRLMESESEWLLKMDSGARYYFSKSRGLLLRMSKPAVEPAAFNQFLFSNHASIEGQTLPRRIQVLSNDEKSTIFLLIQALELNPSVLSFDIGIPDDIPVERI